LLQITGTTRRVPQGSRAKGNRVLRGGGGKNRPTFLMGSTDRLRPDPLFQEKRETAPMAFSILQKLTNSIPFVRLNNNFLFIISVMEFPIFLLSIFFKLMGSGNI
jgi:hypothetical protein